MAQRIEIQPLTDYAGAGPVKIVVNGSYWFLRLVAPSGDKINGTDIVTLGTAEPATGLIIVELDFPPIFNGDGVPIPWNDEITFLLTAPVAGSVIQVYVDPVRPNDRV